VISKIVKCYPVAIWGKKEPAMMTLLKCFKFWWNPTGNLESRFLDSKV